MVRIVGKGSSNLELLKQKYRGDIFVDDDPKDDEQSFVYYYYTGDPELKAILRNQFLLDAIENYRSL